MIRSMTGFAQEAGSFGSTRWTWEFKALNAKGLDLRLRLPPSFDALDGACRQRIAARLSRGTCAVTLVLARDAAAPRSRINVVLLGDLLRALTKITLPASIGPATLDGLLGVRGVVEADEATPEPAEREALEAACADGFERGLAALVAMREDEGAALRPVLERRLEAIARLTHEADIAPERQPAAIRAKLERSVAALVGQPGLDPIRLHQEALLLAAKADVREELDRLAAHVAAARGLIETGGPVGRRLDFLAQELTREASTFCAKVNDAALTAIGLELRAEIEQLREQIQNIE